MTDSEDLSGRKLGEFVLRARIDEGGFGEVYRCDQPTLGREAVVKVLHPRLRNNTAVLQRFLREAQLASRIDHPCAAHVYAFGIEPTDGLFWIAMELVQGIPLHRWLRERGAMALDQFVPFFEQLAEVVDAAHGRGIVHRDLKPSNVMVIERAGRLSPKLLDFGVAKLLEAEQVSRGTQIATWPARAAVIDPVAQTGTPASPPNDASDITRTASETSARGKDWRHLTHADSTVGSPPYMSPEQWSNPVDVGPASDLYALAVVAFETITGRRPFHGASRAEYAALHREAPVPPVGDGAPPGLDGFFARALAKRPEERWGSAPELAAALRAEWIASRVAGDRVAGATHASDVDDEPAPYLGLASYATSDAARFVGREVEVAGLIERLRARPLQVIVGPSGTGKSSFVHAGVIPRLPSGWRCVSLRPGAAPLTALAYRLKTLGVAADDLRALLATSPVAAAGQVVDAAAGGTIVIVIDQLEELFTLCGSTDERDQFAAAVAQLAASADLPVRVIATIRDDFLMRLDALSPLRPMLSSALVLLGNPLRDELIRIVVEPAQRAGYELSDPALAGDMVGAVVNRPGALAVLSFAALRLWELRDRTLRQLTRSAFEAMGGVTGAFVRHAEATFEALPREERRAARDIFRHLVTADGARAQLTVQELQQRLSQVVGDAVVDKLVAARLIAIAEAEHGANELGTSSAHIEIVHDALIDGWPRLRGWIREDADGARMREQLRIAARQWNDRGRPHGLLWRDDVLVDLRRWTSRPTEIAPGGLEAAFVEASVRLARRARLRRVLGLIALGFVIAFAVFLNSWMQSTTRRQAAEQRVTEAYADRGLDALLEGKHTEALAYLAAAARRGDDSPKMRFMFARAAQPRMAELGKLTSPTGRMWWTAYSPDGKRIVTTDDNGATIWDAATLRQIAALPHGATVYQAAFSPDGSRIVTASADGHVRVWDATAGRLDKVLPRPRDAADDLQYWSLTVAPTDDEVAAIDTAGRIVQIWNLVTGQLIQELRHDRETTIEPVSPAFSHDGRWFATSSGDDVQVYDTATWRRVVTVAGLQASALSFDPTGPHLATASVRGDVSIWDLPTGRRLQHLHETYGKLLCVTYSPNGRYVAVAGEAGFEQIWDASTGEVEGPIKIHRGRIRWIEFDQSSRLLVSTGSDGVVAVSDVARQVAAATFEGPRTVVRVAHFDPTSHRVIAASWDGTVRMWDAARQYMQWGTAPLGSDCRSPPSAAFEGRFVAVDCPGHATEIWDVTRQRLLAKLPAPTSIPGVTLSPAVTTSSDGDLAAVAAGNRVVVYALPGGEALRTIQHADAITAVTFSYTGRELISGSLDGSLVITPENGEAVQLARLSAAIRVVAYLPNDRVVVADASRQLHVYDAARRSRIATLDSPEWISAVRWSADGRRLIALAPNGVASPPMLYDLERFQMAARLDGNPAMVFMARFVRDDREIVTASNDGVARIWEAATGRLLRAFVGSSQYVTDAALDPAGELLVTAGGDGVLRFWDVASARMIWILRVDHVILASVRFEGEDIMVRTITGSVSRWKLPRLSDFARTVEQVARCLPLRLDDASGRLVEQEPVCDR